MISSLTYTSNAIEGNTLSAAETTLVIERGITIGGKPLKDHLEAIDHYEAIGYVRALARQGSPLTEADLRQLHHLVVQRSHPEIAGRYADQGRYVLIEAGTAHLPLANGRRDLDGVLGRHPTGASRRSPAQPSFGQPRRLVN
jgi:Fic family protein